MGRGSVNIQEIQLTPNFFFDRAGLSWRNSRKGYSHKLKAVMYLEQTGCNISEGKICQTI